MYIEDEGIENKSFLKKKLRWHSHGILNVRVEWERKGRECSVLVHILDWKAPMILLYIVGSLNKVLSIKDDFIIDIGVKHELKSIMVAFCNKDISLIEIEPNKSLYTYYQYQEIVTGHLRCRMLNWSRRVDNRAEIKIVSSSVSKISSTYTSRIVIE